MFRKPTFWIALTLLSLASALGAIYYFPKAFPLVSVEITMDRQMALTEAQRLADRFGWEPEQHRAAASYQHDSRTQNYVELEAGGLAAYREMLEGDLYSPYTWQVRLFQESQVRETRVRFTPRGEPYGFGVTLPEDEPGPSLTAAEARSLAESAARQDWQVDLSAFVAIESTQDLKPGGRLDHTFVYRRQGEALGEGEYRLRLRVGGDQLTELTHFVHIPESFERSYDELRSKNNALATAATIAAGLLFFFGGCVVGLFFMLRQGYLVWRTPVYWGSGIALLVTLTQLNAWPLQWMHYDTAVAIQNHIARQVATAAATFIAAALVFSVIFMAAESLSRRAFPRHIQLWKTWSRGAAPSWQVLGMTLGALLLVSVDLFFVTGSYHFTTGVLGWWSPSHSLFDPNVVAQYFPWYTAVVGPLQAAFWEEALFRAVPIAGAVLLGRRFGGTTYWVVGAFILQALVFGAAHANYPMQPFYARALELIVPSLLFGALFYLFGLYPAILLHFWYNVVFFAMPIFAASTPGILVDKILVVLIALLPLWIILGQWLRTRALGDAPDHAYNKHWQPAAPVRRKTPTAEDQAQENSGIPPMVFRALLVAGLVGLVLWASFGRFTTEAPPVDLSRAQAEQLAENILTERGMNIPADWKKFSRVWGGPTDQHRFVWQEGGEEAYRQLLGEYLTTPLWYIRWATFAGNQEARAEEFQVYLFADGRLHNFTHNLPEARPGARLEEDRARALAERAILEEFARDPALLQPVSADSTHHPERTDWFFAYADTEHYPLERGEARVQVRMGGDQVINVNRYTHVPEDWSRQERDQRALPNIIQISSHALVALIFLAGGIIAIFRWSNRRFHLGAFFAVGGGALALGLLGVAMDWPSTRIGFSTAEPYTTQLWTMLGGSAVGLLFVCGTLGLIAGLLHSIRLPTNTNQRLTPLTVLAYGLLPALCILGLLSLINSFLPSLSPNWGAADRAGALVPWLSTALQPVQSLLSQSLFFLMLFGAVHYLCGGWQKRKAAGVALLFVAGFMLAGLGSVPNLPAWLVVGIIWGVVLLLLYGLVLRYQMALVIPMVAAGLILNHITNLTSPMYSGAIAGYLLAVVLIATISVYWYRSLTHR